MFATRKQPLTLRYSDVEEGCKALIANALGISDGDNITILLHYFRGGSPAPIEQQVAAVTLEEKPVVTAEGTEPASQETEEKPLEEQKEEEKPKELHESKEDDSGEHHEPVKKRERLRSRGDHDTSAWINTPSARLSMVVTDLSEEDREK